MAKEAETQTEDIITDIQTVSTEQMTKITEVCKPTYEGVQFGSAVYVISEDQNSPITDNHCATCNDTRRWASQHYRLMKTSSTAAIRNEHTKRNKSQNKRFIAYLC